jgi:hypothetical protein
MNERGLKVYKTKHGAGFIITCGMHNSNPTSTSLGCYPANTKETDVLRSCIVDGKVTHDFLVVVSS